MTVEQQMTWFMERFDKDSLRPMTAPHKIQQRTTSAMRVEIDSHSGFCFES